MKESQYSKELDIACKDFYSRFQSAFGDVRSGVEIDDIDEIHRRLLLFFGGLPYIARNDNIWWTRGVKAMQLEHVSCSDDGTYYLGRLECRIDRLIPYDYPSGRERMFVYLHCDSMPSLSGGASHQGSHYQMWKVEPVTLYEGKIVDEGLADNGVIIDQDGNYKNVSQDDFIRFDRFVSPQNLLLTAKACPLIRYESSAVWNKMDEILCNRANEDDLRRMIQETDCYLRR